MSLVSTKGPSPSVYHSTFFPSQKGRLEVPEAGTLPRHYPVHSSVDTPVGTRGSEVTNTTVIGWLPWKGQEDSARDDRRGPVTCVRCKER